MLISEIIGPKMPLLTAVADLRLSKVSWSGIANDEGVIRAYSEQCGAKPSIRDVQRVYSEFFTLWAAGHIEATLKNM